MKALRRKGSIFEQIVPGVPEYAAGEQVQEHLVVPGLLERLGCADEIIVYCPISSIRVCFILFTLPAPFDDGCSSRADSLQQGRIIDTVMESR